MKIGPHASPTKINGSTHVDEEIESLLNKDIFLVTSVRKDSSVETPTPNLFPSRFGPITSIVPTTNVISTWFNQ